MNENNLVVSIEDTRVGVLHFNVDEDRFSFIYEENWKKSGFPLSPVIPLGSQGSSVSIRRYLENQFPEGRGLEILLEEFRVGRNNIFRIIQLIGNESTGALRFSDEKSEITQTPSFRELTDDELIERLNDRNKKGLVFWDGKPRLSVAGVQDKLPVTILANKKMGFGDGSIASTHILKFQKQDQLVPHLVMNEYFCMKLAKAVGIEVADVEFKRFGPHPVLIVKRFDRILKNDQLVERRHIVDGCQALDLPSSHKYERNFGSSRDVKHIRDGASLKKLFDFCLKCEMPASAILKTMNWVILNLCLSNADSHAKNISYYIDRRGIFLTPTYDLVNISVYPDLEQDLAMAIGDEFKREEIMAFQLKEFCEECNIQERLFIQQFRKIGKNILNELDKVETQPLGLTDEETQFVKNLRNNIQNQTKKFLKIIEEIPKLP